MNSLTKYLLFVPVFFTLTAIASAQEARWGGPGGFPITAPPKEESGWRPGQWNGQGLNDSEREQGFGQQHWRYAVPGIATNTRQWPQEREGNASGTPPIQRERDNEPWQNATNTLPWWTGSGTAPFPSTPSQNAWSNGTGTSPAIPQGLQDVGISTSAPLFLRDLELNMHGDDVTLLQRALIASGYMKGAPTGFFGALTQGAIRRFEKAFHLPQNGRFQRKNISGLFNGLAQHVQNGASSTPPVIATGTPAIDTTSVATGTATSS